jgi:phospholipid/cholesterol/gamma-HCH transport system permease protein
VTLLRQFGAQDILGTVLVIALFRELAPLLTALIVLVRAGTTTVVELATLRATGQVEALEALSIDPVHFLVVPRVIGLAISVFCLTVYFLIGAILSGYLFCYVQQLPLSLGDYLNQLVRALSWQDFLLLLLKTGFFGTAIAIITCYQGLARPLRLEQVPNATTRAVTQSLGVCVALDVAFVGLYLVS